MDRGWALFGESPPEGAAGQLDIGSDRLRLVVDGQALLDELNPYAPDGWWAAIDGLQGRCVVVIARDGDGDGDVDLAHHESGQQLTPPAAPPAAPIQGYVLEWRRHSHRWAALLLVSSLDEEGRPTAYQRWLPTERLAPVRSDPNNGGRARSLS